MRIGVICPSDIATRRFMPALMSIPNFSFGGIGVVSTEEWEGNVDGDVSEVIQLQKKSADRIVELYGGVIFDSYNSVINSEKIDAVYIPLPPALHYKWTKKAIEAGKHVLIEKPSTTSFQETKELIRLARKYNVALRENYMFVLHRQIDVIQEIVSKQIIGEVRQYRVAFGFPRRQQGDFRYIKSLGGGALLDAGGYTLRYATMLLEEKPIVMCARLNKSDNEEVDIFGSGMLTNSRGITVQLAFGMDNSYKCELEVWGSRGTIYTNRVFTAPSGYLTNITIRTNEGEEIIEVEPDDTFRKSIMRFGECIYDEKIREENYIEMEVQAELVDEFIKKAKVCYV